MKDNYIPRHIEKEIVACSEQYPCLLIVGPPKIGKTETVKVLKEDRREYISLSTNAEDRALAKGNPANFLKKHPCPILVDDIHYAPELFLYIQQLLKKQKDTKPGMFWFVGSALFAAKIAPPNAITDSLAILHMFPFSQRELYGKHHDYKSDIRSATPLRPDIGLPATLPEICTRIHNGFMPELYQQNYAEPFSYYDNYVQIYIDEICKQFPRINEVKFYCFIAALSLQIGQVLNLRAIANTIHVSADTAKRWLMILQDSGIVFLLYPYSAPHLKRTHKRPKIYFFDTGLASYFTWFKPSETLLDKTYKHPLLENYVIAEYQKIYRTFDLGCPMWYYKDKEHHSVDLIVKTKKTDDASLALILITNDFSWKNIVYADHCWQQCPSIPYKQKIHLCTLPDHRFEQGEVLVSPIWGI